MRLHRAFPWLAISTPLAVVVATAACGPDPRPCPTDPDLIERFEAQRADFETVLSGGGDEALRDALGIVAVRGTPPHFVAWEIDFPGPGGASKGYVWMQTPPGSLVDSLDDSATCGGPGLHDLYRALGDGWYLYYTSAD